MHTVYKYVCNQEIIYIGKCDSYLPDRLSKHGKKWDNISEEAFDEINRADIYTMQLPNRVMTDVVESELIRRYKPKYNKAKTSDWGGIPFVEPEWKPYRVNGKHANARRTNKKREESEALEKGRLREKSEGRRAKKQYAEEIIEFVKQDRLSFEELKKQSEEVVKRAKEALIEWNAYCDDYRKKIESKTSKEAQNEL